jgi:3D (Asp-Asp-Asp) domain-containing protein
MALVTAMLRKKTIGILSNTALLLAVLSQIFIPTSVKASIDVEMANSTQKVTTIMGGSLTAKPEKVIRLAMAEEIKKAEKEKTCRIMAVVMTAYTSTPGQTDSDPFTAASGKRVFDGMIAANGLPFGTEVYIPSLYGDKKFSVEDRMNSRYGLGRMDIWLDTTVAEARKFGVKRLEVKICPKPKVEKEVAKAVR